MTIRTPDWIASNPDAKKLYVKLAKRVAEAGRLNEGSADVLGQYVMNVLLVRDLGEQLRGASYMVKGVSGTMKINPMIPAMNKASAVNLQLAKRLGLVDASPQNKSDDFADLGV